MLNDIVFKSIVNGVNGRQQNAMQLVGLMPSKDGTGKLSPPQCLVAAAVMENQQKTKSATYLHVRVSNINS